MPYRIKSHSMILIDEIDLLLHASALIKLLRGSSNLLSAAFFLRTGSETYHSVTILINFAKRQSSGIFEAPSCYIINSFFPVFNSNTLFFSFILP